MCLCYGLCVLHSVSHNDSQFNISCSRLDITVMTTCNFLFMVHRECFTVKGETSGNRGEGSLLAEALIRQKQVDLS